jgi:hypothetical protein
VYAPLTERESEFRGIVFSHATGVVIASYDRHEDRRTISSLYFRDPLSTRYERLPAPDDRTSFTTPVAVRDAPYVFFNVMRITDDGSSNWLHVARAHLLTRAIEVVLSADELLAITNSERAWPVHPWVWALMQASDGGTLVTCKVGVPEPQPGGRYQMKYSIFDLNVTTRSLSRLADLADPFG